MLSLGLLTGHRKDLPLWRPGQGYEQAVPEDERLHPQHCCSVCCLRKLSSEVCALERLRARFVAWTLQHLEFYLDILSTLEIPVLNWHLYASGLKDVFVILTALALPKLYFSMSLGGFMFGWLFACSR